MITLLGRFALVAGGSLPASIVVKAMVIAALALIGTRLARGSRAAVRHVLLAAAFGVLLLLPLASVIAPPIQIAVRTVEQESAVLPSASASADPAPRFSSADTSRAAIPALSRSYIPSLSTLLLFAWLAGVALSLIPLLVGLREIRALRRTGLPWMKGQAMVDRLAAETGMTKRVEMLLHESLPGPVASGALHPAILLPMDAERWERDDLHRALVHELEHVWRADLVIHSLVRAVCSLYWFHPLVWMAWRQLTLEAERACDDAVLKNSEATAYADQLVALARQLLASDRSPLLAMANRSDLAVRVSAVLDDRQRRGRAGRVAVAATCAAVTALTLMVSPLRTVSAPPLALFRTSSAKAADFAIPLMAGLVNAPAINSESAARNEIRLQFEVATIKPVNYPVPVHPYMLDINHGMLRIDAVPLIFIVGLAYHLGLSQMQGAPHWTLEQRYNVLAKSDNPNVTRDEVRSMLQALLIDRCKLAFHQETKNLPVLLLEVGRSGPKLKEAKSDERPGITRREGAENQVTFQDYTIEGLAGTLSGLLGTPVLDKTGLTQKNDFTLTWSQEGPPGVGNAASAQDSSPPAESAPSLFTALQEQLGLRLEKGRGPVAMTIIDHIERPSEN